QVLAAGDGGDRDRQVDAQDAEETDDHRGHPHARLRSVGPLDGDHGGDGQRHERRAQQHGGVPGDESPLAASDDTELTDGRGHAGSSWKVWSAAIWANTSLSDAWFTVSRSSR